MTFFGKRMPNVLVTLYMCPLCFLSHNLWIFVSCLSFTGMGSGGSAGKEAGPLKALLRQHTQSALEQRVRQTHIYLSMYMYSVPPS